MGAGCIEEVHSICWNHKARDEGKFTGGDAGNERQCCVTFAFDRGFAGDQRVRAIGSDEIDDRGFILEVPGKVDPALIGLEQRFFVRGLVKLAPRFIE